MKPRVAFVTGGNRGIGFEVCRALAAHDCSVLMGTRDLAAGRESAEHLKTQGLEVTAVRLDVSDTAQIIEAVNWVESHHGQLDILVNNAGVLYEADFRRKVSSVEDMFLKPSEVSLDLVRKTFEVNVFGAIAVTSAFLPLLRRSSDARIISISSRLASIGRAAEVAAAPPIRAKPGEDPEYLNLLAYNSSKSALNAAMLQFMIELRGSRINVELIDPGHCATDINDHSGDRSPRVAAQVISDIALGAIRQRGRFWQEDGELPW